MTRYRNKRLPRRVNHSISSKPERLDNNINSLGNKTPILHLPLQNSQTLFRSARPSDNNKHILAMLYTLTTPTNERTFNFGTDSKRRCRLPIMHSIGGLICYMTLNSEVDATSLDNLLLRWHSRLSHMHFQKRQDLAQLDQFLKSTIECTPPICCSCLMDKAHCR